MATKQPIYTLSVHLSGYVCLIDLKFQAICRINEAHEGSLMASALLLGRIHLFLTKLGTAQPQLFLLFVSQILSFIQGASSTWLKLWLTFHGE